MLVETVLFCMLLSQTVCQHDIFTSIREMERLFDLEHHLMDAIGDHLKHTNFEMDIMVAHYKDITKIESEIQDIDSYAANPVNAYSVVKRLVKQWPATFKLLADSQLFQHEHYLPDQLNLTEMIIRLVEWQLQTGLRTETLARGWLEGIMPHANLTAEDCYDIAVYCYDSGLMNLAAEWMNEALYKIRENGDSSAFAVQVLEYSFLARCLAGDLKGSASAYLSLLADGSSSYIPSKGLRKDFQLKDIQKCKYAALKTRKAEADESKLLVLSSRRSRELCHSIGTRGVDQLSCSYEHFLSPYLRLRPSMVEHLSLRPLLLLFHGVLSDDDILHIRRASVTQIKSLSMGKTGPIHLPEESFHRSLDRKISTQTNLDLTMFAEANLVTVYGPESPNDFQVDRKTESKDLRPQVGKIIYFLNNVAKGGYTVFPSLQVSVEPRKGSALLWLSDSQDLEQDECPVLIGYKWMMTKVLTSNQE